MIPLVGFIFMGSKTGPYTHHQTNFLFPRYCDEVVCKSNSASAALNKWLSKRVPDGMCNSFIQTQFLETGLGAVECPQDITDRPWWLVSGRCW